MDDNIELGYNSTFNVSCNNSEQCRHINLLYHSWYVCVDNWCRCPPDLHAIKDNVTTKNFCKEFSCKNDKECQDYDPYRKCLVDANECTCQLDYLADLDNGLKCIPRDGVPFKNEQCTSNQNCTQINPNMTCVLKRCKCKPNYKIVTTNMTDCQPYNCMSDEDCQEYDKNRVCDRTKGKGKSQCVCKMNFKEDSQGVMCQRFSMLNEDCYKTEECNIMSPGIAPTQRCINEKCKCIPDAAAMDGKCVLRNCSKNVDCSRDEDPYRECSCSGQGCQGSCWCRPGYSQNADNGNKCEMFVTSNGMDIGWTTWWIYIVILIGWTLILLCVVFVCFKCRKLKKRHYITNNAYYPREAYHANHPEQRQVRQDHPQAQSPSYIRAESVRADAESIPFTISGTSNNINNSGNYNFDLFRLLQMIRPNYFEPPPSYDSIPGARLLPRDGVQFLNLNTLDQRDTLNTLDTFELATGSTSVETSEPIYENLPGQSDTSNGTLRANNSQSELANSNGFANKLEQLSMQL